MKFPCVIVWLADPGRQTVPKPRSSSCKAPVAEPCVGPWNITRMNDMNDITTNFSVLLSMEIKEYIKYTVGSKKVWY